MLRLQRRFVMLSLKKFIPAMSLFTVLCLSAMPAMAQASDKVPDAPQSKEKIMSEQKLGPFPLGQENTAYAKYFIGKSYLQPLTSEGLNIANVTFEPGCRNNWHIHHATKGGGQILLCTAGKGWYQEWGKPARALKEGDSVVIPAGVKHWHGAQKDSWFVHIAIAVPGEGTSNEWLEPVSDAEYAKLK